MRCGRTCRSSVSHSGGLALCGVQDCSPMYSSKSPRALLRSLSSFLPVSSWPSFPLGMRISVNGASGVRVWVWLRVILKYVVADALNYAKAPDSHRGAEGDGHGARLVGAFLTGLAARPFVRSLYSLRSLELPATTVGEWRRRHSLRRHKAGTGTQFLTWCLLSPSGPLK